VDQFHTGRVDQFQTGASNVLTGYISDPEYWGDSASHGGAFELEGLVSLGFFF
jgi:hypothetical protein